MSFAHWRLLSIFLSSKQPNSIITRYEYDWQEMMKNRKSRRETEFLGEIYLFSLISNRMNSIITRYKCNYNESSHHNTCQSRTFSVSTDRNFF